MELLARLLTYAPLTPLQTTSYNPRTRIDANNLLLFLSLRVENTRPTTLNVLFRYKPLLPKTKHDNDDEITGRTHPRQTKSPLGVRKDGT